MQVETHHIFLVDSVDTQGTASLGLAEPFQHVAALVHRWESLQLEEARDLRIAGDPFSGYPTEAWQIDNPPSPPNLENPYLHEQQTNYMKLSCSDCCLVGLFFVSLM